MSKDIPLAISGPGGQTHRMFYSEPVLQPVDWKKEAELMRIGREKRLSKKQALSFLKLAGIDPKTGMVIAKSSK